MAQHQTRIMTETFSQDRIGEIAGGLIKTMKGVAFCHGAKAQSSKLWKDEPHPVGLLVASRQFLDDPVVHGSLGLYEAYLRNGGSLSLLTKSRCEWNIHNEQADGLITISKIMASRRPMRHKQLRLRARSTSNRGT